MTALPLMRQRETGAIEVFGRILEGRGKEPATGRLAKELAADEPRPSNPIMCPTCKKIAGPSTIKRHMAATGHGEAPQPERVPNEVIAAAPGDGDAPMGKNMKLLKMAWESKKSAGGKRVNGKRECTVCGAVVDDTEAGLRKHSQATQHGSFGPYFK